MTYYLFAAGSGLFLASSLILFRNTFFGLVQTTTALLNSMLDAESSDDEKQAAMIKRLGRLLLFLLRTFLALAVTLGLTILPIFIYSRIWDKGVDQLDISSVWFYLTLSLGSIPPFIVVGRQNRNKDYSDWSKLLHRIILDNYHISRTLFGIDKKLSGTKLNGRCDRFIIVTGLARAGTTALTTILDGSPKLFSLSYANMPFLLSPKLWGKFYTPKSSELKERSHGDKVLFGHNTVEALEEYFWKVFLNDSYIKDKYLQEHSVTDEVYREYLNYQTVLKPATTAGSMYLAKNNNFVLRYKSIRKRNDHFILILLFRDPVSQAKSLLTQHERYQTLQNQDVFVIEYMNWLGHHEFGNNHKWFKFGKNEISIDYSYNSINYWINIWLNYYEYVLKFVKDPNLFLLDYQDFLENPNQMISHLEEKMNIALDLGKIDKFNNPVKSDSGVDPELKKKAYKLYRRLREHRLSPVLD